MLLSYKFDLKLKYEVKFHKSKSQPHAKKWHDSGNICKIAAPSSVILLILQLSSSLKTSLSLSALSIIPPLTQILAVCEQCHCTHVHYKPQAKCRRDPLPCVDSTVDPHCFFVGFIISRELRKRIFKT